MPVQAGELDRAVVVAVVRAAEGLPHEHGENGDADDHVERVQAGHHEVQREEDLRVGVAFEDERRPGHQVLVELVAVLDRLDPEEDRAEHDREDEEHHLRPAPAELRAVHRERHREARADEDGGVEAAEGDVEVMARLRERLRVREAIHGVHEKEPAEEEDLLRDEHPHAELRGTMLVLGAVELVRVRVRPRVASGVQRRLVFR